MMELKITDNAEAQRFEAEVDGHLAVVEYERSPGKIALTHTGVPPELEGRGIASGLARQVLETARREGLLVLPFCPFLASFIRKRREEYADILAPGY